MSAPAAPPTSVRRLDMESARELAGPASDRGARPLDGLLWRAVRRQHPRLAADPELVAHLLGFDHHRPIGVAAHDDADQRRRALGSAHAHEVRCSPL